MGIKGKTTFELTDVNTGEVERYTDTNMVTNALRNFWNSYGTWGVDMFRRRLISSDYIKELLGGLFLFDTTLEENVDNTIPPYTATMIGNGAVDVANSGTVTELGSYNVTESGWQNDGSFKFVYDFSTAQANGSIACACLTSKMGGYAGWGNAQSEARVSDGAHILTDYQDFVGREKNSFLWLETNNTIYASYNEDTIYSIARYTTEKSNDALYAPLYWATSKKIRIEKRYGGFKTLKLFKEASNKGILEYWDIDIPSEILTYMGSSTNYAIAKCDPISKNAYIMFNKSQSVSAGSYFYLMKVDKDRNVTTYRVYNNSNITLYIYKTGTFFDGEYIYLGSYSGSDNYRVYKINYTNSAEISKTSITFNDVNNFSIGYLGNKMFLVPMTKSTSSSSQNYEYRMYNAETDKLLKMNGAMQNYYCDYFIPLSDIKGVYLAQNTSRLPCIFVVPDSRYLATINNLAQPVVKTANKTMKVTYTVTFDDEG
jgi:hypothetical protein